MPDDFFRKEQREDLTDEEIPPLPSLDLSNKLLPSFYPFPIDSSKESHVAQQIENTGCHVALDRFASDSATSLSLRPSHSISRDIANVSRDKLSD